MEDDCAVNSFFRSDDCSHICVCIIVIHWLIPMTTTSYDNCLNVILASRRRLWSTPYYIT